MTDILITINPRAETAEVRALTHLGREWLRSFTFANPWYAGKEVIISAEAAYDYTTAAIEAGLQVNTP